MDLDGNTTKRLLTDDGEFEIDTPMQKRIDNICLAEWWLFNSKLCYALFISIVLKIEIRVV